MTYIGGPIITEAYPKSKLSRIRIFPLFPLWQIQGDELLDAAFYEGIISMNDLKHPIILHGSGQLKADILLHMINRGPKLHLDLF